MKEYTVFLNANTREYRCLKWTNYICNTKLWIWLENKWSLPCQTLELKKIQWVHNQSKNFFLIKRFKSRSWSKTERARPEGSRERNLMTFFYNFLKNFSDYYLRFFSAKRGNRRRPRISRRRQRHCELYFKAYVENLVSFRESWCQKIGI